MESDFKLEDVNNIEDAWDYLYTLLIQMNKLTDTVKIRNLLTLMTTIEQNLK